MIDLPGNRHKKKPGVSRAFDGEAERLLPAIVGDLHCFHFLPIHAWTPHLKMILIVGNLVHRAAVALYFAGRRIHTGAGPLDGLAVIG